MLKKCSIRQILCVFLVLAMMLTPVGFGQTASAASSTKPNVTKVTIYSSCVTVKWSSVSKAKAYYVYRSVNGGAYKKVKTMTSSSYSDYDVSSGKKYSYKIKAKKTNKSYTSCGSKKTIVFLSKPSLKAHSEAGYMNLTWEAVTGANYYKVLKWNGSKWIQIWKGTGLSCKDASVKNLNLYYYKIRAYLNKSDYSALSSKSACIYIHNHSYAYTVNTPATCTESGTKTGVCACGKTMTKTIKALGHNYLHAGGVVITQEPTCTEKGSVTHTCSRCGYSFTKELPSTGHFYNNGTITVPATCTEQGVMTYTCAFCGDTYTEEIPAKGHSWNEGTVTKDASCTEVGTKTVSCTVCGETQTQEIPALSHSYDEGKVTTAPTCSKKGVKTYTCTRSGCDATKTESIDEIDHDWEDIVEDVEVPDSDTGSVGHWDYSCADGDQNSLAGTYIECQNCDLHIYRANYNSEEDWLAAGYEHIGVNNQDCTAFNIHINRYINKQVYTAYDTRTESRVVGRKCKCCGLVEEHEHQWVQDTVDRWTKTSKIGTFAYSKQSTFDWDTFLTCTKCGFTVHEHNFATWKECANAMSDHNLSVGGTNSIDEVAMVKYEYYLSPGKYVIEDTDDMSCSICGEHKD